MPESNLVMYVSEPPTTPGSIHSRLIPTLFTSRHLPIGSVHQLGGAGPGELRHPGSSERLEPCPGGGLQRLLDTRRYRGGIEWIDQDARARGELLGGGPTGGHHRSALRHGLEHGETEALEQARETEDLCPRVEGAEVGRGHEPQGPDPVADT